MCEGEKTCPVSRQNIFIPEEMGEFSRKCSMIRSSTDFCRDSIYRDRSIYRLMDRSGCKGFHSESSERFGIQI